MTRPLAILLLASAVVLGVCGCKNPTAYEKGQQSLAASRELLLEGDRALAAGGSQRAAENYSKATESLAGAISPVEDEVRDLEERIRAGTRPAAAGSSRTPMGSQDAAAARYYAESLVAHRKLWGLMVAMRGLALSRTAEAHYRAAALAVLDGDQFYRARQFNQAARCYGEADQSLRKALDLYAQTADFLNVKTPAGSPVALRDPPTGDLIQEVRQVVAQRRGQADAYLSATVKRANQTAPIVEAYRDRAAGNVPTVQIPPLAPLPDLVRHGARQPPVPSHAPPEAPAATATPTNAAAATPRS